MTQTYDLFLSKIRTFYDLDNLAPIQCSSSVYTIERTPRDYDIIKELFNPDCAQHNISKIKQMSSLFDLLHYVDPQYSSTKNSKLRIDIYNRTPEEEKRGLVQFSFGNVLSFSISKMSKKNPEDILFASKKSLTIDTFIEDDIFEKIYSDNLDSLSKYVEPNMTFKLFNEIDKKTLDEVRIENLANKDLSYHSLEAPCLFYNFDREHDDFFKPLKKVFSNNLLSQVKSIESLLRFESDLKYGKLAYGLEFNYSVSKHKFRTPTYLYVIMFSYDYELSLSITLYFKFKTEEIRYLEVDLETNDTIDVSGYEAIYEYILNRIKTLLTTTLDVSSEYLNNQSVLLYKMLAI